MASKMKSTARRTASNRKTIDLDAKRARFLKETVEAVAGSDLEDAPFDGVLLSAFSDAVIKKVEDRYIRQHSGADVAAQMGDSLAFLMERGEGEIRVRVFTPTLEERGYMKAGTVVETLMRDQPFLFNTIKQSLADHGVRVLNSMNVVISVERDAAGGLQGVGPGVEDASRESYCRFYVDPIEDPGAAAGLCQDVRERLETARQVVSDFRRMEKLARDLRTEYHCLGSVHADLASYLGEAGDFLDWLVDGHFLFMGASVFEPKGQGAVKLNPEAGLGIKTGLARCLPEDQDEANECFRFERPVDKYFIRVGKSAEDSRVHRPGKIDHILVRRYDMDGRPAGGVILHGLFTYKAISSRGGDIPILQKKISEIVQEEEALEDTHQYKAISDAFNSLPVEFLFTASSEEITRLIRTMLSADREGRMSFHLTSDDVRGSAYLFAVVPKGSYSDELRMQMEGIVVAETRATYRDHRAYIGKANSVILHFFLTGGDPAAVVEEELYERLVEVCSPWLDRVARVLTERVGEDRAFELVEQIAVAFPDAYRASRTPEAAATDVFQCERVVQGGGIGFELMGVEGDDRTAHLTLYESENIYLTDILPVLDNFGLRVRDQDAYTLQFPGGGSLVMDSFRIDAGEARSKQLLAGRDRILEALRAVFSRSVGDDPLNRLITETSLGWEEVDVLRAYIGHARQLDSIFTKTMMRRVVLDNPAVVEKLIGCFRSRFAPTFDGVAPEEEERTALMAGAHEALEEVLGQVGSFQQDRMLRALFNGIQATLRTNAYRTDRAFHYLSFKLACDQVVAMHDPRPWREIYVHHIDMEGIHMRGGAVARGGLRWSDRPDDYRSEVLGLMTTQMIKNTLIVPVGAKGGFVLKGPPPSGETMRAFADRMYQILIRGLLDLTDNRTENGVEPPRDTVRHDGDDPYLVVAADKGTAHLSDTANALSAEYGFWLDDAFASGGSTGYDHKVEGITAKGAWACTRRHFSEMGMDPETDSIRVVGIGDMSGDVFGNGMILSQSMQLVAAFNHLHVFLDPDPDPAASFAERTRLFGLPRSAWTDYSADLISAGGGVFDRQAKSITLSPEVSQMLGVDEESMSGEALIHAVLAMPVDLLWNGGIGTYVKAVSESDREVSDSANDALRRDAPEIRARVIGEGGNLGVTQRGRVEYALSRGRINTDAVDNAGGVNLSDHEVNLKVLFAPLIRRGEMTLEDRNALLREVAAEVVDDVVVDNEVLSLRISLDERRSRVDIFGFGRCIKGLKDAGILNLTQERLPFKRVLEERQAAHKGLTRPELAVVGSYVKMRVYRGLLAGDPLPESMARRFLDAYFPDKVASDHQDAIAEHMLRHEILCTVQTNQIVDYGGATLFHEMEERTGRPVVDIVRAYLGANAFTGADELKAALRREEGTVSAEGLYQAFLEVEQLVRDGVFWILSTLQAKELFACDGAHWETVKERFDELRKEMGDAIVGRASTRFRKAVRTLSSAGIAEEQAQEIFQRRVTMRALPAATRAVDVGFGLEHAARLYAGFASYFRLDRLARTLEGHASADPWEAVAIRSMADDFARSHDDLVVAALQAQEAREGEVIVRDIQRGLGASVLWKMSPALGAFLLENRAFVALREGMVDAGRDGIPQLAKLLVLSQRLHKALESR
jgi:glutamate dehydrogenase